MTAQFTNDTLAAVRQALSGNTAVPMLNKSFTLGQPTSVTAGLQAYNLDPVVKSLVPFQSPLRDSILRVSGGLAIQANWRAITSWNASQIHIGASEGRRGGRIAVTQKEFYAAFRTMGMEGNVSQEAINAGQSFDDVEARMVVGVLQSLYQEEEKVILGGNATTALARTGTPTLTLSTTGGTIAHPATTSVVCVALTMDALRRTTVGSGLQQQTVRANADGTSDTVNGGCARPSVAATVATASGSTNSIVAKVTPTRGAFGYAWYVGASGAERLHSVTTVAQTTITVSPSTGQLFSLLSDADYSRDQLIYDGLLGMCGDADKEAYYATLTNGSGLTADGSGGITEIDTLLATFYDTYFFVPDEIIVSTQEANSMKLLVARAGVSTSLARFVFPQNQGNLVMGNTVPIGYNNIYGTPKTLVIRQHPFMPKGTMLFATRQIPYPQNGISEMMRVYCRQDYWQQKWPQISRSHEFGVYTDGVLQHFWPATMGVITNISPTTP